MPDDVAPNQLAVHGQAKFPFWPIWWSEDIEQDQTHIGKRLDITLNVESGGSNRFWFHRSPLGYRDRCWAVPVDGWLVSPLAALELHHLEPMQPCRIRCTCYKHSTHPTTLRRCLRADATPGSCHQPVPVLPYGSAPLEQQHPEQLPDCPCKVA